MPQRLNVMGPGEFIRFHLIGQPAQRDFVGGMYRAYKGHLRAGGVTHLSCRSSFQSVVWMLKETQALAFDGAEAISFDGPVVELPPDYVPGVSSPSPRHYYRLVDPQHPAFDHPRAVWQQQRGLPPTVARPRAPRAPAAPPPGTQDLTAEVEAVLERIASWERKNILQATKLIEGLEARGIDVREVLDKVSDFTGLERSDYSSAEDYQEARDEAWDDILTELDSVDASEVPVAPPAPAPAAPRRAPPAPPRQTVVERLVAEGQPFRERIEALREDPDPEALATLEAEQLDWFDRVLDAADSATGDDLRVLIALGERLEAAAKGYDAASTALAAHQAAIRGGQGAIAALRLVDYLSALELILTCCP